MQPTLWKKVYFLYRPKTQDGNEYTSVINVSSVGFNAFCTIRGWKVCFPQSSLQSLRCTFGRLHDDFFNLSSFVVLFSIVFVKVHGLRCWFHFFLSRWVLLLLPWPCVSMDVQRVCLCARMHHPIIMSLLTQTKVLVVAAFSFNQMRLLQLCSWFAIMVNNRI